MEKKINAANKNNNQNQNQGKKIPETSMKASFPQSQQKKNQKPAQNNKNKKPNNQTKKNQPAAPRQLNPNNKFDKNIIEITKMGTEYGYEINTPENSRKIYFKKTTEDGLTSNLLLIPMGVDRWLNFCEVKDKTGKVIHKQNYDFSFRATKDVVRLYAASAPQQNPPKKAAGN